MAGNLNSGRSYLIAAVHNVWTTNDVSAGDPPRRVSGKIDYRLEIELNLVYFLISLPAAGSLAVTSLSDFTVHGVAYKESSYLRRRCL